MRYVVTARQIIFAGLALAVAGASEGLKLAAILG